VVLSRLVKLTFLLLALLWYARSWAQEVYIGNPGKSLNFFHFDLAIERGFFRELGLDVKLLNTKCDVAVTALLTGDLQATGCVGTASCVIASQNVPVRTVIWLFKKPTFYVVAKPEIKSAADLCGKTIGISSFGSDTDLAMKVYAQSGRLDPESDNGLATDKGLKVMVETLGTAVGKNVDFPPERLVDYTLLKEVQKELGM
jgi:ABC-type nitrate/sulfonate/bicarbonate transport system substrate-binding protein